MIFQNRLMSVLTSRDVENKKTLKKKKIEYNTMRPQILRYLVAPDRIYCLDKKKPWHTSSTLVLPFFTKYDRYESSIISTSVSSTVILMKMSKYNIIKTVSLRLQLFQSSISSTSNSCLFCKKWWLGKSKSNW